MRKLSGACVMLAFCVTLSAAADPTSDDAIKLIEKLKGKKARLKVEKNGNVARVDLSKSNVTDADLKTIAVLKGVRELNLEGTVAKQAEGKTVYAPSKITDEGLKNISGLTDLKKLELNGANITDDGLKQLAGMKNLEELVLSGCTKLTDGGMENLTKLPKLARLSLFDTKITEDGIAVLKRWKVELKIAK